MQVLHVGLNERSYPITISAGCLASVADDLATRYKASRYCIVADDTVAELYSGPLLSSIEEKGLRCDLLTFPHGEESKTLETVGLLARGAAQRGLDRKSMFIALGGGVTGDITGFLASTYMRGIPFIQIPTTLLAQVDSSVGGKTGVDIPEGKNLVGTFYQPQAVYIDIEVLRTLPKDQYLSGLAEVIKHGFIRDNEFLRFLDTNRERLFALESEPVTHMIYTCCKIKSDVVSEDEKESNVRRILNFGHTIGHAVEAASQFSIFHGLAVAIGMVAATRIALRKKMISEDKAENIIGQIKAFGMPTEIPESLDRDSIKTYLLTDKKMVDGKLYFILPKEEGGVLITDDVTSADIDSVIQ